MSIYQETSNVQGDTASAGIITNKRSIDTNVLVNDGQIIVLGGLIEDSLEDGEEKVPFLGDIPLIGNLFKYQKRNRVKKNLMVFLRPTVIRNNEQSVSLSTDRYDYIRNEEINGQSEKTLVLPDMESPLLPSLRIDGQMEGGVLFQRDGAEFKNAGPATLTTPQAAPATPAVAPEQAPLPATDQ